MARLWQKPIYPLKSKSGKNIVIDVTTSVSLGLPPHQVVKKELIPFLKRKDSVERILDFGAGALRHTLPLLKAGFQVCVVEFEDTFKNPISEKALKEARKNANFSTLIWPHQFLKDKRKFDVALLCFVLQTMPIPSERITVLRYIYKKLRSDGCLFYTSRYGQISEPMKQHRTNDGFYMWPNRKCHSFYREFTTEETHKMTERLKFHRLRSFSKRGTEQIFLYGKGKGTWI